MKRIACNPFVYRQTPVSRFSHFEPTDPAAERWIVLEELVARYFEDKDRVTALKEDGTVVKMVLPLSDGLPGRFFSAVVEVDENTVLKTAFGVRPGAIEGEQPFIQTVAVGGRKAPAQRVEVILYHVSVLKPEERSYVPDGATEPVVVDAEWQIVSVNCQATDEPEPPTPQAMARNMAAALGLPEGVGGTARTYTPEEFMRAILYWSRRTMASGW
jgi:hypothetical protein